MGAAATGVADAGGGGSGLEADATTGSAFTLRPVAEDQLVMISATSSRRGEFLA